MSQFNHSSGDSSPLPHISDGQPWVGQTSTTYPTQQSLAVFDAQRQSIRTTTDPHLRVLPPPSQISRSTVQLSDRVQTGQSSRTLSSAPLLAPPNQVSNRPPVGLMPSVSVDQVSRQSRRALQPMSAASESGPLNVTRGPVRQQQSAPQLQGQGPAVPPGVCPPYRNYSATSAAPATRDVPLYAPQQYLHHQPSTPQVHSINNRTMLSPGLGPPPGYKPASTSGLQSVIATRPASTLAAASSTGGLNNFSRGSSDVQSIAYGAPVPRVNTWGAAAVAKPDLGDPVPCRDSSMHNAGHSLQGALPRKSSSPSMSGFPTFACGQLASVSHHSNNHRDFAPERRPNETRYDNVAPMTAPTTKVKLFQFPTPSDDDQELEALLRQLEAFPEQEREEGRVVIAWRHVIDWYRKFQWAITATGLDCHSWRRDEEQESGDDLLSIVENTVKRIHGAVLSDLKYFTEAQRQRETEIISLQEVLELSMSMQQYQQSVKAAQAMAEKCREVQTTWEAGEVASKERAHKQYMDHCERVIQYREMQDRMQKARHDQWMRRREKRRNNNEDDADFASRREEQAHKAFMNRQQEVDESRKVSHNQRMRGHEWLAAPVKGAASLLGLK